MVDTIGSSRLTPLDDRWQAYESLKVPQEISQSTGRMRTDLLRRPSLQSHSWSGLKWGFLSSIQKLPGIAACFGRGISNPLGLDQMSSDSISQAVLSEPNTTNNLSAAEGSQNHTRTGEQFDSILNKSNHSKEAASSTTTHETSIVDGSGEHSQRNTTAACGIVGSEVNNELVDALLGLVDGVGGGGWVGCHWETVCVTDGITVYRARFVIVNPFPS
jgi:hypothetical protein